MSNHALCLVQLGAGDDHDIEDMYYTPAAGPNQPRPASAPGRHAEHTPPLLSPPALQSHPSGTHPSEEGVQLGLYDDADADEDELELQARFAQMDVVSCFHILLRVLPSILTR